MKNLLLYISILILTLSSCTKNFEDINKNPNHPPDSDPNYIFNYVCKEIGGEYGIVTSYNITYAQRWIMQTSAVYGNSTMPPYTLFDQYRIQNLWEYYYTNLLLNCHILEKMTSNDVEQINKYHVARILLAYGFMMVTDLWGDIPYTETFLLLDDPNSNLIKPGYDTQEMIYNDLINILKVSADNIDLTEIFYDNDYFYNGDLAKWVKFANSLRLRLAVRSNNSEVVSEIIDNYELISSNSESFSFTYPENTQWWNPYYETNRDSKNPSNPDLTGTSVTKISELMKLQLESTGDPRLPLYAQPIEIDNTSYRGVPNLMNSVLKEQQAMGMGVGTTSYIGKYFSENPTWTRQILSYAEVCFLRAEAAFRGWTGESAQEWYEKGVRAALESYEIEETDISDFLSSGGAFNNELEQIITQKWIALFLNGWEAFAEYRRTGFPQLKKYDLELDGIKILSVDWVDVPRNYVPGRLPYPDDEVDLNNQNYLKAVEHMGGDSYYQQLWWSEKFGTIDYVGGK